MSDEAPGPSAAKLGLWAAVGAVVIAAGWLLVDRDAPPRDDTAGSSQAATEVARLEPSAPSTPGAPATPPPSRDRPLPDGVLGPIIGDPRGNRIDICDERNWRFVGNLVHEVRAGELLVEESAWQNAGASTRAGVASWASKCRLDDAPLVVVGADSGHELGRYAATSGYERFQ